MGHFRTFTHCNIFMKFSRAILQRRARESQEKLQSVDVEGDEEADGYKAEILSVVGGSSHVPTLWLVLRLAKLRQ